MLKQCNYSMYSHRRPCLGACTPVSVRDVHFWHSVITVYRVPDTHTFCKVAICLCHASFFSGLIKTLELNIFAPLYRGFNGFCCNGFVMEYGLFWHFFDLFW